MSYGDAFLGGFQTGSSFVNGVRDRKDREKQKKADELLRAERQLIEDTRYQKEQDWRRERALVEDARFAKTQEALAEERMINNARADKALAFQRHRAASQDLLSTMELGQRASKAFGDEITAAREDPFKLDILAEQARRLRLENDQIGRPRPVVPTETLELDPMTGEAMSRKLSGPAGSFGELTGDASPGRPGRQLSEQDGLAIQWAQQNPNDPRAAAILKRLGIAP